MKHIVLLFFLLLPFQAYALRATDSTTANTGVNSTYASVTTLNYVQTSGYQNAYSLPVGSIITWPASVPLTSPDSFKYLECDGRAITKTQYPELYEVLQGTGGSVRIPNLNGWFLRGTTDPSLVLSTREDHIKSHTTDVEDHTHLFNERMVSTAITGNLYNTAFDADVVNPNITANLKNTNVTGTVNPEITGQVASKNNIKSDRKSLSYSGEITATLNYGNISIPNHKHTVAVSHSQPWGYHSGYGWLVYGSSQTTSTMQRSGGYDYYDMEETLQGTLKQGSAKGEAIFDIPTTSFSGKLKSDKLTGALKSDDVSGNIGVKSASGRVENKMAGSLDSRSIHGNVTDGTIAGEIYTNDDLIAHYPGSTETNPRHTLVRYFIKAIRKK